MAVIERGDIWWADLSPTRGREQRGHRPVAVISSNRLHEIPLRLLWILPLTTRDYGVPNHIKVEPDESGLPDASFVMCEQIRTIDEDRLDERVGRLADETMREIDEKVRWLAGLGR